MKKILALLLFCFCFNVQAYSSITVYDKDGGRILYSINGEDKALIASTTKIMTAVVALENSLLENKVTIEEEDVDTYGSSIYLKLKDEITFENLLYGLLLRSGNDAALTLANNIFGYTDFINSMNIKAFSIGMHGTIFQNPHGLDEETKNISTTNDMVKLMSYAMDNPIFQKINLTKKYMFNNTEWINKNELMYNYKYMIGGKTGYTPKAGYTYVSNAKKNGKNVIIASFNDKDRFTTHKKMYEKIFNEYEKYQVLNKYTFNINNKYYKNEHLYIKNDYFLLLNDTEKENLTIDINLYKEKMKDKMGYVSVKLNNIEIHREYIYSINYEKRKKKVLSLLFN